MLASELLGREVVDAQGRALGVVHDVRVAVPLGDHTSLDHAPEPLGVPVVAVVVGPSTFRTRLAYAWGFAQGRTQGPSLLRLLVSRPAGAQTVAVTSVTDWDFEGRIRVTGDVS